MNKETFSGYVSVEINTPQGSKTIGCISNLKEFEYALKEIEKKPQGR